MDFPGGADGKESACKAGDRIQSLGLEDPLEKGIGNPLQYSCLENPIVRGAWRLQSMGSQRVGHNLVTNEQHKETVSSVIDLFIYSANIY